MQTDAYTPALRDPNVIDSHHKLSGLVLHLMQYCAIRELCPTPFPGADVAETPEGLGFRTWWNPPDGMQEDWYQDVRLQNEQPCVLHLCKDWHGAWFAYRAPVWPFGRIEASAENPALADSIAIIKRLAELVRATHCSLVWNMHDQRTGAFVGEVIVCESAGGVNDEEGRLLRCYVTDREFRIAWYAEKVAQKLSDSLAAGGIRPLPHFASRGSDKLKDHMSISRDVPEREVAFCLVRKN